MIVLTNMYLHSIFTDLQKANANYIFTKSNVTPKEVVKAADALLQPPLATGLGGARQDAVPILSHAAPAQVDPVSFKPGARTACYRLPVKWAKRHCCSANNQQAGASTHC